MQIDTAERLILPLAEATVLAMPGRLISVRMPDGTACDAVPAFTVPYRPVVGDQLLVIGDRRALYAIGVVAGAGEVVLSVSGDLTLHARSGRLRLSGDEGVEIDGPNVVLTTPRLEIVAERVVELLGSAMRRVRDLFTLEAGRSSTFVAGHASHHSETAVIAAADTVTVSGKQVHLG